MIVSVVNCLSKWGLTESELLGSAAEALADRLRAGNAAEVVANSLSQAWNAGVAQRATRFCMASRFEPRGLPLRLFAG
jgi:hypothetical protein